MAVSKRLRYEILRRDNNTCRYCGGTAPAVKLTVDHVVPVSLGGQDDPENLVACCGDCNAGKSSIAPDSPLVASVADDALRWATAMQYVAVDRARDRQKAGEIHDKFLAKWNTWTYTRGIKTYNVEIPGGWESSINRFIESGLELDDLTDLVDVAMAARTPDAWRYFCGCAWNAIKRSHEKAREMVDDWESQDAFREELERKGGNENPVCEA